MKFHTRKLAEALRNLLTKKVSRKELDRAKHILADYDAERTLQKTRQEASSGANNTN